MSISDDIQEIFEKMPEAFLPEKAGGDWIINIANHRVTVEEGQAKDPNLTLGMAAADYAALSFNEADAMGLFMAGKIKVAGDVGLAMKFQNLFERGRR